MRRHEHEYYMVPDETGQARDEAECLAAQNSLVEPCPFCGCGAQALEIVRDSAGHYVQCVDCAARVGNDVSYAKAAAAWDRRKIAGGMSRSLATCLAFAARYAHNRETGAAMAVCNALKAAWHRLSEQDREQILRETDEATTNRDEWNALIVFAATFNPN